MHKMLRTLQTMGVISIGSSGDRMLIKYMGSKDKETSYGHTGVKEGTGEGIGQE
jgi:hypothetical protein